jgi:hypothetical protein
MEQLKTSVKRLCDDRGFTNLRVATTKILEFDPENPEVKSLKEMINESFKKYVDLSDWLNRLDDNTVYEINSTSSGSHAKSFGLLNFLTVEELSKMERADSPTVKLNLCLLRALCDQIDTPTDIPSFIRRYKSCFRQGLTLSLNIAVPTATQDSTAGSSQ